MPDIDKIEKAKRLRVVQEWILDDYRPVDIIANINSKWGVQERQAKRYISLAVKQFSKEPGELIEMKRKKKILKLQKLARSINEKYKGTPEGVRALLAVEREIITLEGIRPAKQLEVSGPNGSDIPLPLAPVKIISDEIDYSKLSTEVLRQLINARVRKYDTDNGPGPTEDPSGKSVGRAVQT